MKATARESGIEGRIMIVASEHHWVTYKSGIRLEKINNRSGYGPFYAYGQSKLANILHAKELARRLQEEGAQVTVNSLHPGVIPTNIMRSIKIFAFGASMVSFFMKNAQQGAATTCYMALHPNMKGVTGKYFSDCNEAKPTAFGRDAALAKKLWEFSEEMISTKLPQQ